MGESPIHKVAKVEKVLVCLSGHWAENLCVPSLSRVRAFH